MRTRDGGIAKNVTDSTTHLLLHGGLLGGQLRVLLDGGSGVDDSGCGGGGVGVVGGHVEQKRTKEGERLDVC